MPRLLLQISCSEACYAVCWLAAADILSGSAVAPGMHMHDDGSYFIWHGRPELICAAIVVMWMTDGHSHHSATAHGQYQACPCDHHDHSNGAVAGLVMNSTVFSSSLNSALSLNVTLANTSSSSSGPQLTNYTLTTAAVDNTTFALSGDPITLDMRNMICRLPCVAKATQAGPQYEWWSWLMEQLALSLS